MRTIMHWRRLIPVAGLLAATLAAAGPAVAQEADYPNRPVRMIVPYAPGGSSDQVARPFAERLSQMLGQQFVIDNKGGAGGAIGAEAAQKSAKDGYTLLMAPTSTLLIVPNTRKTVFGLADFVGVAKIADAFAAIAVHPSVPANTMAELVAYSKANPGKINFGTAAVGGIQHLRLEAINRSAGLGWVHVPYRGSGEAMLDLLSGQVQMMTEVIVLPHIRSGKLKAIVMVDVERNRDFPNVPTLKEASRGLPFENLSMPSWFMLFAPAGTPRTIVTRLNKAVVEISRDPALTEQLFQGGYRVAFDSPEKIAEYLPKEDKIFADLIREVGLRQE